MYKLTEDFPSLREKCFDKIRQIAEAQVESRKVEAFPVCPIFPPPLVVVYAQVVKTYEPMSESSTADPMSTSQQAESLDSYKEAMDYSPMQSVESDVEEVSSRTLFSNGAKSSHNSDSVEMLEPNVAFPPLINAIPLSAATRVEFTERFPSGDPNNTQAEIPENNSEGKSEIDTSITAEYESSVSEADILVFRHLYGIDPTISIRIPLENERAFDGRDGEICVYEQMFKLGFHLPIHS